MHRVMPQIACIIIIIIMSMYNIHIIIYIVNSYILCNCLPADSVTANRRCKFLGKISVSEDKLCSIFVANAVKELCECEVRVKGSWSAKLCILCNCNKNVISRYLATLRLWSLYVFPYIFIFFVYISLCCFLSIFLPCDIW